MRDTLNEWVKKSKKNKRRSTRITAMLLVLSLLVSLGVFFGMRQTGITMAGDATCGMEEHTHTEECIGSALICGLSEEAHTHGDACFERSLICTDEEHEHEDACFETTLICGLSEEAHTHNDACFEDIVCEKEEHVHSIMCYSDETADVETQLEWQEMADAVITGDLRSDLAAFAKTQIGYRESERNFIVDDDGNRHGYTRYGGWYGVPYSDWSAMFVSFCLNYAGSDTENTPFNTGANSMAALWDNIGKLKTENYSPETGDIVFFTDNTAAIAAEVSDSGAVIIQGDVNGEVVERSISLTDSGIYGWGDLDEPPQVKSENTDITSETPTETDEPEKTTVITAIKDMVGGTALFSTGANATAQNTATDIEAYLAANGGSHSFALTDTNDVEIPKDAQGNYVVVAKTPYKLVLVFDAPNGFAPGTYTHQLPAGLELEGGKGKIIVDEVELGTWDINETTGLMTLVFNEESNRHTEVHISASMGVVFHESNTPLVFDGEINVTVTKPPSTDSDTVIQKWGNQGNGSATYPDTNKIYWQIDIAGHENSAIPRSLITDMIYEGNHKYTESDMKNGIAIEFQGIDANGNPIGYHKHTIYPGEPNLQWTETGWSYIMPEKMTCEWCNKEFELGNDGWYYYIKYTSTHDNGVAGGLGFKNHVTFEGKTTDRWVDFAKEKIPAGVIKEGSFWGDANGGKFNWKVNYTIPGKTEGQKAVYKWYTFDTLQVNDSTGNAVALPVNNMNITNVTFTNNGQTFTAPNIKDATSTDQFAWYNEPLSEQPNIHTVYFLHRCSCDAESCPNWNSATGTCDGIVSYEDYDGKWKASEFCHCWNVQGNTEIVLEYEIKNNDLIFDYGGAGYVLSNRANLYYQVKDTNNQFTWIDSANDDVSVPIPGVFKKEVVRENGEYIANFTITVNEAKIPLVKEGSPLVIHDVMTETLVFMNGSLTISSQDAEGNTETLVYGEDFTYTYDGSGTETDANGNSVHVLDITINEPGPVTYTLNYSAVLVIPDGHTGTPKYSNSATISIWGEDLTVKSDEKVMADVNFSAQTYNIGIDKIDTETKVPLEGAEFGLFNANGGLITSDTTDKDGKILFQTNITQGIILREHIPYYIQEISAPEGYILDNTKYWFYFSKKENKCEECLAVEAQYPGIVQKPSNEWSITWDNTSITYQLPETGGTGIYPYVIIGAILIAVPLLYGWIYRRKRERRGSG